MKAKSLLTIVLVFFALSGICQQQAADAPYKNGVGLLIDLGEGVTLVGPHLKHFINGKDAVQGMLVFGNGLTVLGVEYSYNSSFPDVNGLTWNVGIGPQLAMTEGYTSFALRPSAGLEFQVPEAPISLGFDWRPLWQLSNPSDFLPGRFGLAFKYTF